MRESAAGTMCRRSHPRYPHAIAAVRTAVRSGRQARGGGVTVARKRVAPRAVASLSRKRLPELDLVSFRIDDPGELPVLGIVDLLEHVAAFLAQDLHEREQVLDAVVDHERRGARRELVG